MNINEYISSGILELYVAGALTEAESVEVTRFLKEYPEIKKEVEQIEAAFMNLSGTMAPSEAEAVLLSIKGKLLEREDEKELLSRSKYWPQYLGWAASILLLVGLFLLFQKNQALQTEIRAVQIENNEMRQNIFDARDDAEKARELLNILRNQDIQRIALKGQQIAPGANAVVYFDKQKNRIFLDAKDLPTPPRDMVYQVWSLKMNPLIPTSIGLLDEFEENEEKIFSLENANSSEGFGITLEPAGGSKMPTMERLYSLGTVAP